MNEVQPEPKAVLKLIKAKADAYEYLGTQDRHIVDLLHWVEILEKLKREIQSTDMHLELGDELGTITQRLTHEIGVRMTWLFP